MYNVLAVASTQPVSEGAMIRALQITGIGMLTILVVMGLFGLLIVAIGRLFPEPPAAETE
jgi:hypothetical protein